MGVFTVATMFTQLLDGNGRLRRIRFPVLLNKMWTYYHVWTTFRTLAIVDLFWTQPNKDRTGNLVWPVRLLRARADLNPLYDQEMRVRLTGHVTRTGEMFNTYSISVGKP
jgi:hypothetical protein